MPVAIRCTNCDASYRVADAMIGRAVRCKKCDARFVAVANGTASPPAAGLDIPNPFGKYQVIRKLGRGGMGAVYLAYDDDLERHVALKVPHAGGADEAEILERFRREVRAAAQMHDPTGHRHFCAVYEASKVGDRPYLAMAYVQGETIESLVDPARPMDPRAAVVLVKTIALAMADAHDKGIVHRDLKPSNVIIDVQGQPIIMDFGLTKREGTKDIHLTSTNVLLGTPRYMSPEQVDGTRGPIGPATDIYSLGVILYELLTGHKPLASPMPNLLFDIVLKEPPPASDHRPGLDPALVAICRRALSKSIGDRPKSMRDFAEALDGGTTPAPPPPIGPPAPVDVPDVVPDTIPSIRPSFEGSVPGEAKALKLGTLDVVLRWCPPGMFTMGSPKTEPGRDTDEDQVEVTLTQGFWMMRTQVTQELYQAIIGDNPSYFKGARLPVETVSHIQAVEFARQLTTKLRDGGALPSGWAMGLPTEAQWEYAARAGTRMATPFGDKLDSTQANFDGNHPYNGAKTGPYLEKTAEVGSYEPNAWGLCDTAGNVWEWTADAYEATLRGGRDPHVGGEKASARVVRGGGWFSYGRYCRSARRFRYSPGDRFSNLGFRLAAVQSVD